MKYIWCEDTKSGYFFWQQINKVFFNNECIVKCSHGVGELEKEIAKVINDGNDYLVCFDNCVDNNQVKYHVNALQKTERQSNNITLVDYICFEQVLLSSPEIIRFIPNINNDPRYNIVLQHIAINYADTTSLVTLCINANLPKKQYATTERFFRPIIEDNAIISSVTQQLPNGKSFIKNIMCHHYIYKGSWSRCWYDDCTPSCPNDYCWKTQHDCQSCTNPKKNHTCIKSETFNNFKRKFEEETQCNRESAGIPTKYRDRIRMLFENSIIRNLII